MKNKFATPCITEKRQLVLLSLALPHPMSLVTAAAVGAPVSRLSEFSRRLLQQVTAICNSYGWVSQNNRREEVGAHPSGPTPKRAKSNSDRKRTRGTGLRGSAFARSSACFRTVPYGTGTALFWGAIRRVELSRDCRIRHFRQLKLFRTDRCLT